MALIGVSIKLQRVDKALVYQDSLGCFWLSAVLTFEADDKGRKIIAQSIPKERYAGGERGPAIGTWREIGNAKPPAPTGDGGLSVLRAAREANAAKEQYPSSQERLFPEEEPSNPGKETP
jgi:hypothetical protein